MDRQYTSKIFLVFLASLAGSLALVNDDQGATLKFALAKDTIKPGDTNVELICEVNNIERTEFINYVKKVNGVVQNMATNKMGEGEFKAWFDAGRYAITYKELKGTNHIQFKLTISKAELGDAGEVGCRVPTRATLVELKNLTVLVAPASVALTIINNSKPTEYTQDKEVPMEHGNKVTIQCVAKGSAPAAQMSFTIGKKVYKGKITAVAKPAAVKGTEAVKYETTLKKEIMVESTWNKKAIQCRASTKGIDNSEKKSSSVTVKMSGSKPQFICAATTVMVKPGDRNVVLNCTVHATPAADYFKWYWYRNRPDAVENNLTISLKNGEKDGHYSASVVKGEGEDQQIMLLKIDLIANQMFRKHYFVAKNDQGETTFEYEVIKDPSYITDNSATQTCISRVLMATLALLCLCLRV